MKPVVPAALLLPLVLGLAAAHTASADPRMETNKNFCHFILDPANTDNEFFVAGCDSSIVTVEPPPDTQVGVQCVSAVAQGYGLREAVIPQAMISVPAGRALTLTSKDSDAECTMVESNGRAYRSRDWRSTISVRAAGAPGMVRVRYVLICRDGTL